MTVLRRPVFRGFLKALDACFTPSFLHQSECSTPPEPLLGGKVDSAVRLGVDTADGWFDNSVEHVQPVDLG